MRLLRTIRQDDFHRDMGYILFQVFLMIVTGISLSMILIHLINQRPLVNILTAGVMALFGVLWLYLSRDEEHYALSRISFSVFIALVYVPFGYITSPGSLSAMPYLVLFSAFILSLIARKPWEYVFPLLIVVEHVLLLYTEVLYPQWYEPYQTVESRIMDLSLNYTVISLFMVFTLKYIMGRYNKHNKKLLDISLTDALTGLYNKRYIDDFAEMEFVQAQRENTLISLAIVDLNNFKNINDQLGHVEGDKVLQDIAEIIRNNIRSYDICARYGGDQFLILLPGTREDQARKQIIRLNEKFDNFALKYQESKFSVSIGIADSSDRNFRDVLKMADKDLYPNKMNKKGAYGE